MTDHPTPASPQGVETMAVLGATLTRGLLQHAQGGLHQLLDVLLHDGLERLVVDKAKKLFAPILVLIF